MYLLKDLEPKNVFHYFEEICAIPHGSGNTRAISDYCVDFAKKHNLNYIQDNANNIIIFKDGAPGYEDSAPVIIQGHLDMVCEKEADCAINFEKDGLQLELEGDYISARGTTLGGDDGIAVAYALAILEDDTIPHPPLEIVLTVDEEIGMLGASALDYSPLRGRIMLNLDSEDEGILLVSCAGGVTATCNLPIARIPYEGDYYTLTISGLTGGHSGVEIDKGRANANQLLGRILYQLSKETDILLADIHGGLKDNAIPREAVAVFALTDSASADPRYLETLIEKYNDILRQEYQSTDAELRINLHPCNENISHMQTDTFTKGTPTDSAAYHRDITNTVMDKASTMRAITALYNLPGGVVRMSRDIEGLVQTSLNMGILKSEMNQVVYNFSVRSSVATEKTELLSRIECLMQILGGSVETMGDYPAWEYRKDSPLRSLMVKIFEAQYGYKPEVQAFHAGVECGLFAGALLGLDCVSFGPVMHDIHTPKEELSISSVERTWKYILEILKQLK